MTSRSESEPREGYSITETRSGLSLMRGDTELAYLCAGRLTVVGDDCQELSVSEARALAWFIRRAVVVRRMEWPGRGVLELTPSGQWQCVQPLREMAVGQYPDGRWWAYLDSRRTGVATGIGGTAEEAMETADARAAGHLRSIIAEVEGVPSL